MSIDWITVAAQIANFLVLIWLLKRFLYRPILDGIDAREAEIADRMAEAAQVRAKADAAEAEYKARTEALESDRAGVIETARAAAAAERDELLAEARDRLAQEEADRARMRTEEAKRYSEDLHRSGAAALLSLTRKALHDLADETLEARIVQHALPRLSAMGDTLRDAAGASRHATVLTRDPLDPALRNRLAADLDAVAPGLAPSFETDPSQAPGLTLRLGGAQVAWTLDSYMDGLDALLADAVATPTREGRTHAA